MLLYLPTFLRKCIWKEDVHFLVSLLSLQKSKSSRGMKALTFPGRKRHSTKCWEELICSVKWTYSFITDSQSTRLPRQRSCLFQTPSFHILSDAWWTRYAKARLKFAFIWVFWPKHIVVSSFTPIGHPIVSRLNEALTFRVLLCSVAACSRPRPRSSQALHTEISVIGECFMTGSQTGPTGNSWTGR